MGNAGADMAMRVPTYLERQLFMEWVDELHAMTEGVDLDAPAPPALAERANWVGEMMRAVGYVPTDRGLMMEVTPADAIDQIFESDENMQRLMQAGWLLAWSSMLGPRK